MSRRERREIARAERAAVPRPRISARRRPVWQSPLVLVSAAALIMAAVVIAAAVASAPKKAEPSGAALVTPTLVIPAGLADGTALGLASAPAVLDIYSDFQCPFCGRLARERLPSLLSEFVTAGKLRIVDHAIEVVDRADSTESLDSAVAAECAADQGKYWQYHDYLFWNQQGENEGAFNAQRLRAIADAVGLDGAAFDSCVAKPESRAAVKAATESSGSKGVTGTPTLFLNGKVLAGGVWIDDTLAGLIREAVGTSSASASPS